MGRMSASESRGPALPSVPGGVALIDLDPADAGAVRRWSSAMRTAYTGGREAVWWEADEQALRRLRSPKKGRTMVCLAAVLSGETIGGIEVSVDPGEPADVEIGVLPSHRRHGVGTMLLDAAAARLGAAARIWQAEASGDEGVAFALAHGFAVGNREHRMLLDLPAPSRGRAPEPPEGVTIRSFTGACPEDVVADWAALVAQMDEDVPMGELTRRTATRGDVEEVRRHEQRMDAQGWTLVRSIAHVDGAPAGYTVMFVSRHDPAIITQDDTLVERSVRGRGIGRALKAANLACLTEVPEARDARWIQTYTAFDNHAMLALNRALGFREADTLTILERKEQA